MTSSNIDEFLAEPAIDGALVGGASLKPDEMAGIVARAGLTADGRAAGLASRANRRQSTPAGKPRPIVLVILDGFGIGTRPARRRHRRRAHADLAGLLARWPHAALRRVRRTRSACPPARWATRRSAT